MSKSPLVLIGAGGHANSCIDVIEQHGLYQIVGLIGTQEEMHEHRLGYSVIGSDHDLAELAKTVQYALIAMGQIKTPEHRIRLYEKALRLGFQLPTIVAPSAYVSRHAVLGSGTIVMHGAIVNAGARVGDNCIINTRSLVEHDGAIAHHCHISTSAVINGNAMIGSGSFIGSRAVVKEGVSIGTNCLVGMGSVVRQNQPNNARFFGL